MKNRTLAGAFASLVLLVACGKKQEQAPQMGPMPFPVQTITQQDATVYEEYTANLEGQQNVEIRPKVSGFIQKIYVDEGQEVKKGQLLFRLETQTLNQDAAAAKANVDAAQVEVDRLKPLVERKIISNVQLETAKAKLAQAKATYSSIAANIGYGTITSPVNGVIGSLPYKEGSLVSATMEMPLTTVSDSRVMRAYFSMNEKQMLGFTRKFEGRLEAVNGLVNPQTGTTEFRAEFANPQSILRSGSSGIVRLPVKYEDAILVPQNAVMDVQGKQIVYVVGKDNTVKSAIVQTSTTAGLNFIVTAGLKAGDVIVVEGTSKLKDGQQIVPQPVKEEAGAPAQDSTVTTQKPTTVTSQK